jgi:hypothetical protein
LSSTTAGLPILALVARCGLRVGCGSSNATKDVGDSGRAEGRPANTPAAATNNKPVEVGVKPVGDSNVSDSATFEQIAEGIQVVLEASNLLKPGKDYYAQIHEVMCSAPLESPSHDNEENGQVH